MLMAAVTEDSSLDDLEKLRKLAGIDEAKSAGEQSPVSGAIGSEKAEYMRKHNIRPGSDEWFKLWFSRPRLTGENPMPKK
jgi:hypothetical protein